MVPNRPISLLVKEFKIYVINSSQFLFFFLNFFNVDSSLNTESRQLKLSVVIFDIIMQGTMSQILHLGPSFCFICLRK